MAYISTSPTSDDTTVRDPIFTPSYFAGRDDNEPILSPAPLTTRHRIPVANGRSNTVSKAKEIESSTNVQEKKNGRKGIKKSRGGCFTCKRQKLKCKENRPTCDYCAHRNIKCEWPILLKPSLPPTTTTVSKVTKAPQAHVQRSTVRKSIVHHDEAAAPVLGRLPRSIQSHGKPPVFGMEDMRLFNHFIQIAYPNHPHGNDSIWTHEVPSLASEYDYLIHSMLALSASELTLMDRRKSPSTALTLHHTSIYHRSLAVSSLRRATQRGISTSAEGNAMLATILTLLFQSTFIADGLLEYMSFIRGAIVVSTQMGKQGLAILFSKMKRNGDDCPDEREGEIEDAPLLQHEVVWGSIRSLSRVGELCHSRLEKRVWRTLMNAAQSLQVSSAGAYLELRKMYALFAHQMTPSEFNDFSSSSSPSAQTFRILQAHFVALQLIMNPVAKKTIIQKAGCPVREIGRAATVGWLTALHADMNKKSIRYCIWTKFVEAEVTAGRLLDGSLARSACVFEDGSESTGSSSPGMESGASSIFEVGECPWSRNL